MELKYNNLKESLTGIFVGFSIGLSVIVPGISGSSIAIIMRVYDKLLYAFSNLFKKPKECIKFLIPIAFGIIAGFGIGFILVSLLIEAFPFITICFFVGLMAGTYPILLKEIEGERFSIKRVVLFICGIIIPIALSIASNYISGGNTLDGLNIFHYLLFLVIGIIMSLTQLIPGLSATVLLMMFGYYSSLMTGIKEIFSKPELILVYLFLFIGFVIGVLAFSKVISKLLNVARKTFFFMICGLSIGSIISVFIGQDCMEIYASWSGGGMALDLIIGIIVLLIGFALTFLFYIYDKKKEKVQKN